MALALEKAAKSAAFFCGSLADMPALGREMGISDCDKGLRMGELGEMGKRYILAQDRMALGLGYRADGFVHDSLKTQRRIILSFSQTRNSSIRIAILDAHGSSSKRPLRIRIII